MKKPERKRIPVNRDRKAGSGSGEERAYTSNFGAPKPTDHTGEKRPYRPKEEGEEKPYRKRTEDGSGFSGNRSAERPRNTEGYKKPYSGRTEEGGEKRPYKPREGRPTYGDKKPFGSKEGGERKPYGERKSVGDKKPFTPREEGERKPYTRGTTGENRSAEGRKSFGDKKPFGKREDADRKPYSRNQGEEKRPYGERKSYGDKKPFTPRYKGDDSRPTSDRKPAYGNRTGNRRDAKFADSREGGKPRRRSFHNDEQRPEKKEEGTTMTLNKYLAHGGVSGRREAGELVKSGKVLVNNAVMLNPGYRIQEGDVVTYEGRVVKPEAAKVYVLLNKPKGFITTTEDEADRKTVMELVQSVEAERLYPVGRLDRNTTGVLLLTNDGDLAQRLTHPKYACKKIYQVTLDKDLTKADFETIATGVTLEDGEIKADALAWLETKKEIGIEIHSGRNRIVRRIFEHLGYVVEKLDRVMFAGLTKKNVPRGKYRLLTEKEVILLKHFKA